MARSPLRAEQVTFPPQARGHGGLCDLYNLTKGLWRARKAENQKQVIQRGVKAQHLPVNLEEQ